MALTPEQQVILQGCKTLLGRLQDGSYTDEELELAGDLGDWFKDRRIAELEQTVQRYRKALEGLVRRTVDYKPCWCSIGRSITGHEQPCLDARAAFDGEA